LAVVIGLAGNGFAFYLAYQLNSVPPGSSIRPMGLAAYIMLTSGGVFIFGLFLCVLCIGLSGGRWRICLLGLLAIIVCSTPWYVSKAEIDHVIAKNNLTLEP
jgi:hypothetical protein